MVDINRAVRVAAQTGKVELGSKVTREALETGDAKVVVVARNIPQDVRSDLESTAQSKNVPVVEFVGPNTELGPACGKPFAVAAMAVLDAGQSDILQVRPR